MTVSIPGLEKFAELKQAGFSESTACPYWSVEVGYLGRQQILFMARA